MKEAAQIAVALAPLFFAAVFPFIQTIRTGRYVRYFFICWGSLVAWMCVFSMILPLAAYQIDKSYEAEMYEWVPNPRGVSAMLFSGWFPAAGVILIATFVRYSFQWFKKKNDAH